MKPCLVLAALLCIAPVAPADPGPQVLRVMNDSLSMFDWGIFRLQTHLERLFPSQDTLVEVTYDPAANRLRISLQRFLAAPTPAAARDAARSLVTRTRLQLGLPGDEAARPGESRVATYFRHIGPAVTDDPAGLAEELDRIVEIVVKVPYTEGGATRTLQGVATLMGGELRFPE